MKKMEVGNTGALQLSHGALNAIAFNVDADAHCGRMRLGVGD